MVGDPARIDASTPDPYLRLAAIRIAINGFYEMTQMRDNCI
jgi:hypothetical protein